MANTVQDKSGNEIYVDQMMLLADEYVNTLDTPEFIYKPNIFTGLIKYININLFFNIRGKDRELLYDDIYILNKIWLNYTSLVYKYNQRPTIEEYAMLVGMTRETLYSWLNGRTRDGMSDLLNSSRSDTVKKWQEECKLNRYKGAEQGNVGCIFLCKAVDGMVETAPIQMQNAEQMRTIEQIAAERGLKQKENDIKALPNADF